MYNPRNAKLRFRLRPLNNCLFVAVIATALIFTFSYYYWWWIADIILMGLLYYFFFFILEHRPIKLRCPHCEKIIRSNTPWVCGFCQKKNANTDTFPFIEKCEHCSAEPKAYKCHHILCGKIIYLTDDELEPNYAHCLNSPAEISGRTVKLKTNQDDVQDKEHEVQMANYRVMLAKLDAELKETNRKSEPIKIKSPYQQKEEGLKNYLAGVMGARELAAKQKAENEITYKDRPDDLEDANEAVDDWLKRNT
jgi:hypothetical protein